MINIIWNYKYYQIKSFEKNPVFTIGLEAEFCDFFSI